MRTILLSLCLLGFALQNQAQTIADVEGNVYNTISIGTQVWMKQNLKSTRLNDGSAIASVMDNSAWGKLTTPGYCWYNDSLSKYKETYGALYNWYTLNSTSLCPKGWHVPTDNEWSVLISYLGGESVAGGKLKETSTNHWRIPNSGADNSSDFTALPGGFRSTDGTFISVGAFDAIRIGGGWWSSSERDNTNGWGRTIYFNNGKIGRVSNLKTVGFSVRCLKDN